MKRLFFIIVSILFLFYAKSQNSIRLTDGWEYVKGDIGSTWEAFRPAKLSSLPQWSKVTMPHCFNEYDAVNPDVNYYQGPGWYRNYINIDNPYKNGKTYLHFEGAGQKTEVYVYTHKVGKHIGGYDEFSVDITDAIQGFITKHPESKKIPIAIKCDNSRDAEMIPSDLSDFNVYGGLYRYVNLVYQQPVSVSQVHIDYKLDSELQNAEVIISTIINVSHLNDPAAILNIRIIDTSNNEVRSLRTKINIASGLQFKNTVKLNNIHLWHPGNPYLYTVEVSVTNNDITNKLNNKIGFCQVEFKEKGPLIVNGKRLLLKGTHRHEDHAGLAAAMPENLIRKEMMMIKDMGVNFIRLAHYQQSPIVLDLCDSLGFFVWEEIPWCRGGLGGDAYKQQAQQMLTNMINQHYNHPSVLVWGLGNENDWPGDFPEFNEDSIRSFMSELNSLAHKLDSKRKTSIRRCNFCKDIIDVYSPSIWAGWYRGKFTDYKQVSYDEAMEVSHFLHVEWGASSHAGRHSEDPDKGLASISSTGADERAGDFLLTGGDARVSKDGDWSETYACNLIDWHLKEQETMDWLTGTAYWPFKDFSTPLRPKNPIPYVNQKGVVQRDLTPKESFYVFQSYWTTKPMAHIYGHTWETRWGEKNEYKLVKVYSNCSEAELFLNGKSVGVKKRDSQNFPAAGLRWKVNFINGVNNIKVIAITKNDTVTDEISFNYQTEKWAEPDYFELTQLKKDGNIVTVCAKIYDKNGVFCPDSKEFVEFETAGNAELIDDLGTSDGSRKIQMYNGRTIIKVRLEPGNSVISVKSDRINATFLQQKL